jgi:hypothetical protein
VVALLTATLLTAATVRVLILLARSFLPALALSALMLTAATLLATLVWVLILVLVLVLVHETLLGSFSRRLNNCSARDGRSFGFQKCKIFAHA